MTIFFSQLIKLVIVWLMDTVNDEKAEVPEQQDCQDEGRVAQSVLRTFMLLNTPAAPEQGHGQAK